MHLISLHSHFTKIILGVLNPHDCGSLLCGWWGAGIQVVQELLSRPPQRWKLVSGWGFRQQCLEPLSALYQLFLLKDFCHNLHSLWLLPLLEFPEKGKSTTLHHTEMRSCIPQHTARKKHPHTAAWSGSGGHACGRREERKGEERTYSCFRFMSSSCFCWYICLILLTPWACRDSLSCLCCCSFFWAFALALLCWTRKLSWRNHTRLRKLYLTTWTVDYWKCCRAIVCYEMYLLKVKLENTALNMMMTVL